LLKISKAGKNLFLGNNVVIEEGVVIGNNVKIGHNVVIYKDTVLGNNVTVLDNTVLGRFPTPSKTSTTKILKDIGPLKIDDDVVIGVNVVIYRGSFIGKSSYILDQSFIREETFIGEHVLVGRGVGIENKVTIGKFTKIQTNSYLTTYTTVEEYVFIGPNVTTTNDNYMGRTKERFKYVKGPTIKKGARIGGGAILLPGVVIAEESFIGAGALVNKDTPKAKVMVGIPARELRDVPVSERLDFKL